LSEKMPNAVEIPIPSIFYRSAHPAFAGRSLGIVGVNRHLKLHCREGIYWLMLDLGSGKLSPVGHKVENPFRSV